MLEYSWKDQAEEDHGLRLVERNPDLIGGSRIWHGRPCARVGEVSYIHHQPPADVVGRPVELQAGAAGADIKFKGITVVDAGRAITSVE